MLKVAVISPFSPGATSFLGRAAVVQPQEGRTALMWTGVLPLFSYLKTASTLDAPISGFRSSSFFSNTRAACAETATKKQSALENRSRLPFMRKAKWRRPPLSIAGQTPVARSMTAETLLVATVTAESATDGGYRPLLQLQPSSAGKLRPRQCRSRYLPREQPQYTSPAEATSRGPIPHRASGLHQWR